MEEAIRRLGELGLDVHISELDVPIWYLGPPTIPERLAPQPEIYRRVAAACQAQPACFRITTWGFTDRIPTAAATRSRCRSTRSTGPRVPGPCCRRCCARAVRRGLRRRLRHQPAPPAVPQATAAVARLTLTAQLKRQRLRTVLRRRALVVKLQLAGSGYGEVRLTARLRGRMLAARRREHPGGQPLRRP